MEALKKPTKINFPDEIKIEKVRNTPVVGGQAPAVLTMDTYVKNYSKATTFSSYLKKYIVFRIKT